MRFIKFLKNNYLSLLLIIVIAVYGVRVYLNQEEHLNSLAEKKIEQESELESAKLEYEKIVKLEEVSNTSESKETQIRERLNMIKEDEIQFLFSKDN